MKRQGLFFFSGLFGSEKATPNVKTKPVEETSMDVITTSASQPNVLQRRMQEKELTHGETVLASFSPVRLEAGHRKMALFFCPMQSLEISETYTLGDGQELPPHVKVEGLKVPADFKAGLYSLKNVKLTSNGTMQITATENTTWEKVSEQSAL